MKSVLDASLTLSALRWMLLAQLSSLLIHVPRMPWWLIAVLVICIGWRWQVIQGRWRFPTKPVKTLLAIVGMAAIVFTFRKVSVEAAVNFLILAYGLKLIELYSRRDAYISLFLSFLVTGLSFLFGTEMLSAAFVLTSCVFITSALIAMHSRIVFKPLQLVKQAGLYWLSAIPLMIIFFVFFPRMSPFWSIDVGQSAKTGISDQINPGDIAKLSQSDELVFRVRFLDDVPTNPGSLYWRAIVLDESDGRGWKSNKPVNYSGNPVDWYGKGVSLWQENIQRTEPNYPYEVILEPSNQQWLFSLDGSIPEQPSVGLTQDFTLFYDKPIRQTLRYSASLPSHVIREVDLYRWRLSRELQLPKNENPQTKDLALKLKGESTSPKAFVDKALSFFIDNGFRYTLKPPVLGQKANDEFLFDTQRGFCAHYAGALALMSRYAGIPARVVVGYLGGEWNAQAGYLSVRQYDAHAWTEVWFPDQGWVLIDPTSVVAPDRLEQGLAEAVKDEGSFLEDSFFSPHRYKAVKWLNNARQLIDEINYQWSLNVVGYDVKKQAGIWSELIASWGRSAWLMVGLSIVVAIAVPFLIWGGILLYVRMKQKKSLQVKFEMLLFRMLKVEGQQPRFPLDNLPPRKLFDLSLIHI